MSLLPEGAETEFRVPLGKGAARKQKELQIRMAVDNAATLEWRVYAGGHAGELGEEAGEMTLKEAMGYRGENADTLAEKIGIRAGEVRRWMGENGMLRISGARMQQLAAALDGGVLITEDGAEFELYGNGGNR